MEDKRTALAERLYREIVFTEYDLCHWVSKHSIERLFHIIYETYKDLESICFGDKRLSPLLSYAQGEIANLIHDYGSYVRSEKIGILDRLEIAIL
jgi:hypothetical protein